MTRKKNTEEHSNEHETPGEQAGICPVMLISGNWKNFLTEYESKTLIARALNYCVFEHGLVITGYLITNEKVYLVLKIEKEIINRMLMIFFEKIKRSLQKHFASMAKKGVPFLPAQDVFETDESYANLFEEYNFNDAMLVALLTGKKTELPYYQDQLEKLKLWLKGFDFCSFNDHPDAVSQVAFSR